MESSEDFSLSLSFFRWNHLQMRSPNDDHLMKGRRPFQLNELWFGLCDWHSAKNDFGILFLKMNLLFSWFLVSPLIFFVIGELFPRALTNELHSLVLMVWRYIFCQCEPAKKPSGIGKWLWKYDFHSSSSRTLAIILQHQTHTHHHH